MQSGETISIAGLLQDEVRAVASRVPGLGEIPILGALFRSVDYQRQRTELVILVTPEIISPMMPHQIAALPGENVRDPSDLELYLTGAIEGYQLEEEFEALEGMEGSLESMEDEAATSRRGRKPRWRSDPTRLSLHGPWGPADTSNRLAARP